MPLRKRPLVRFFDHYGEKSLQDMRLKVSDPTKLNDPLEFLPRFVEDLSPSGLRKHLLNDEYLDHLYSVYGETLSSQGICKERFFNDFRSKGAELFENLCPKLCSGMHDWFAEYRKQTAEQYRVLCFVDPFKASVASELLMWSHYADGHKGVRIWFLPEHMDVISRNLDPMHYRRNRSKIRISEIAPHSQAARKKFEKGLRDALCVKNICWKYEREWRWLISSKECLLDGEFHYIKFRPAAVVRVDLGLNISQVTEHGIMETLRAPEFAHVKLMKAVLHSKKFELQYEPTG